MADLRPYQSDLIGAVSAQMKAGAQRVLAVAPTGSGKTVMIAHTTKRFTERSKRTLILAHRRSLIVQASNKLRDEGIDHSLIVSGRVTLAAAVRVGSVQTVHRRLGRPETTGYDLIHVDEAHHAVTRAYQEILDANPAARVIGWTATPERLDGRGLGRTVAGPFDTMAQGPTVASLMAGGYLVRASVYGPSVQPDLTDAKMGHDGDFVQASLESVMNLPSITGDAVAHYRRICPGAPGVAFCTTKRHADDVAEAFRADGWRAVAVHGGLAQAEQDRALAGLATGAVHVVTSCELIGEGLDIPGIACIIKLRLTASLGLNTQWDGRPLRPLTGTGGDLAAIARSAKPIAHILDHAGNLYRHGWPDTDREWTLEGRKKRPKAAPDAVQCPTCLLQHPPRPRCPGCGHSYAQAAEAKPARDGPETGHGELELLTADKLSFLKGTPLAKLLPKAKTIEALQEIAEAKGYRPGWAEKTKAARDAAYLRHRYGDRA